MDQNKWQPSLIAPAREFSGRPTQVVVGVIATQGGPQIAIRIGADGEAVILPPQAAVELITNLRQVVLAKYREDNR